jgi:periplasmic divalent cation tolerance protein
MGTPFVIVLTTLPIDADAETLARALIEERLAACVNILAPMQSIYRWEGAIEQAEERQLIMKTAVDRVEELKKRVIALHPYEIPELLVIPVAGGGEDYLGWIMHSVG